MKIGLVAGEASGDLLGAGLIRALSARIPGVLFEGVAGPEMVAAGCEQWEPAESLAVVGLTEPLVHIPRLLRLRRDLVRRWRESPPDVFVGIDAPDFNLGLEKRLRNSGIKTVHYVSPSVWAWRSGRIKTVKAAADKVLLILPFEKPLYDEHGIDAVFVGHPRADSAPHSVDMQAARQTLGIDAAEVVAVLPGSRTSEVSLLGGTLAAAARLLANSRNDIRFVTPIAGPALRSAFERQLAGDHFVQHHAQRPDVRPVVCIFTARLLRRHVSSRAQSRTELGQFAAVGQFSQAEVHNFDLTLVRHHDIGGFDIPVGDAFLVGGL